MRRPTGWRPTESSNHQRRRCCRPKGGCTRALKQLTVHVPWHRALLLIMSRRCQLRNVYPSAQHPLRYSILLHTQRCRCFIRISLSLTAMAFTSQMMSRLTQICDRQFVLRNLIGHRVQVFSKLPDPNKHKNTCFPRAACCLARAFHLQLSRVLGVLERRSPDVVAARVCMTPFPGRATDVQETACLAYADIVRQAEETPGTPLHRAWAALSCNCIGQGLLEVASGLLGVPFCGRVKSPCDPSTPSWMAPWQMLAVCL